MRLKVSNAIKTYGWAALFALMSAVVWADVPNSANHPLYGEVVYDLYNGDELEALTRLLAIEKKGIDVNHGVHPLVLKAGLYQSIGLTRVADSIFVRLDNELKQSPQRDLTWYYLGRVYYKKNQYQASVDALEKVDASRFEDEYPSLYTGLLYYLNQSKLGLQSNLQKTGEYKTTGRYDNVPDSLEKAYLILNQGILLYENGETFDAIKTILEQIEWDSLPESNEKTLLQVRSRLVLGQIAIEKSRHSEAYDILNALPLEHPWKEQHLMLLALAAIGLESRHNSISVLAEITRRFGSYSEADAAVVLLAQQVEKSQSLATARKFWHQAAQLLQDHQGELQSLQAREAELLKVLRSESESETVGLFTEYQQNLLNKWQSLESVQNLYGQLDDLETLKTTLQRWENKIGAYEELLSDRLTHQSQKIARIRLQIDEFPMTDMISKSEDLSKRVEQLRSDKDYLKLLSDDQYEYWTLVESVSESAGRILDEEEQGETQEKLRRVRGVLLWDASEQYFDQIWNLEKQVRQTHALAIETQQQYQQLDQLLQANDELERLSHTLAVLKKRQETTLDNVKRQAEKLQAQLQRQLGTYILAQLNHLDALNHHALYTFTQLTDQQMRAAQ